MHSLFAYGCILLIFISVVLLVLLFAKSKGSALSQFVQENEKEERRLELRNIKGIRMYLPQSVIQEAQKYEWKIDEKYVLGIYDSFGNEYSSNILLLLWKRSFYTDFCFMWIFSTEISSLSKKKTLLLGCY